MQVIGNAEQSRGKEPHVYDDVDVDDDASEIQEDDGSSSAVQSVMSATVAAEAAAPADPSRRSVAPADS